MSKIVVTGHEGETVTVVESRRVENPLTMTLLLLRDIPGIGKEHQIVEVSEATALDMLPKRQALIATPTVRQRFAEEIRKAALTPSL